MTLIRYEIMPFGDALEQAARLPGPANLTVTCSPRHGLDATVTVSEALAARGHVVTPHLAARRMRSRVHLTEVVSRLSAAGIDQAVVIGGDGDAPDGPYATALDLLRAMRDTPHPPRATVGAYPEGHPLVSSDELFDALRAKQSYAEAMTTQMCFSSRVLAKWLREVRAQGIELPAVIGVPGRVDRQALLAISLRIGVGTSTRLLRKQPKAIGRLLAGGGAAQDEFRYSALARARQHELGIVGIHVFTFNRLQQSMAMLESHDAQAAKG
jgi:methylenetetrahydrofolate reductase (NADPH)